MGGGYHISDSLKELSLVELSKGRRTDHILYSIFSGTVVGFQIENITKISGGGTTISGGGSSFLDKGRIEPIQSSTSPVTSTNTRKCTLWVQGDGGAELELKFENIDISFREGHIVHILSGRIDDNHVYDLTIVNENTLNSCQLGKIPIGKVLRREGCLTWLVIIFFPALIAYVVQDIIGGGAFWAAYALVLCLMLTKKVRSSLSKGGATGSEVTAVAQAINQREKDIGAELTDYLVEKRVGYTGIEQVDKASRVAGNVPTALPAASEGKTTGD